MPIPGYKPISDYGVIGNLRTVALVGRDGAIDWCCFPELAGASVFAAVLDSRRGGRFRVAPVGVPRGEQNYQGDTNVLETVFDADGARLTVTDLMPLRGNIQGRNMSEAPLEIHRILRCEGGEVEMEVEWAPRFDYARAETRIRPAEGGWIAYAVGDGGKDQRLVLGGVSEGEIVDDGFGPSLRTRMRLRGGERAVLVTRWDSTFAPVGLDASMKWLDDTSSTWSGWAHTNENAAAREWAGSWLPLVTRSELVLKLLTHADSGAIAAAPTTSLPEWIGGVRNWDYRYCWIRDGSLTVQALIALGHEAEALDFLLWSERVSQAHAEEERDLRIMYGLHGETKLEEIELPNLEGYRGSSPVRIGNGAAKQRQLDIYGELLNSAYELVRRDVELDGPLRSFLRSVADGACADWHKPDYGIWEVRSGMQHFTYSKLLVWLALDRAVHLSDIIGSKEDVERWRETRKLVRAQILERGYDRETNSFVQAFGTRAPDAANLLIPLYELLPFDDPRVQGTIDRTLDELTENGLVYRYHADDGLPGPEGAFGLCTFWLVDALALSGRIDEAWEIFEGIAGRANHVGLLPEQLDAHSGEFLGNFPQAFTHIGLINSRLYLAHAEGKTVPGPPPLGTPEHRAEAQHDPFAGEPHAG